MCSAALYVGCLGFFGSTELPTYDTVNQNPVARSALNNNSYLVFNPIVKWM